MTILIITHELNVVKTVCNRMAVIDESHIVEQGLVQDIFDHPQSHIARLLLGKEEA